MYSRAIRTAAVFLVALAAVGTAVADVSRPINLGATGLSGSLTLRLWKWDETNGWASASVVGITTTELGDGDYEFDDLPSAAVEERYELVVSLTSDTDNALAQYGYGAEPGRRVIWRTVYDPPDEPVVVKQNDTAGSTSLVVLSGLPAAICTATATFTMVNIDDSVAAVTDGAASITNCDLDQTSVTYTATFVFDWSVGGTSTAGSFLGEWEVTYTDATKETFPKDNRYRLKVLADLNGG